MSAPSRDRGQVAGIGWSAAEAAASIAVNGGALLRVMSDGLLRISEASALQEPDGLPRVRTYSTSAPVPAKFRTR